MVVSLLYIGLTIAVQTYPIHALLTGTAVDWAALRAELLVAGLLLLLVNLVAITCRSGWASARWSGWSCRGKWGGSSGRKVGPTNGPPPWPSAGHPRAGLAPRPAGCPAPVVYALSSARRRGQERHADADLELRRRPPSLSSFSAALKL